MAIYAIRDDGGSNVGTATGDGGRYASITATDNWATAFGGGTTGYYRSVNEALNATTPPVAGDWLVAANDHNFLAGGNLEYGVINSRTPPLLVSVDVNNVGQSLAGGIESTAGGSDLRFVTAGTGLTMHGMTFNVGDDVNFQAANTKGIFDSCIINFTGTGDRFAVQVDGAACILINTDVKWAAGSTTNTLEIFGGALFDMTGGSITATTSTLNDLVGGVSAQAGGMNVHYRGVDLQDIDGYLLADTGATQTADDQITMTVDSCQLSASLTGFIEERFASPDQSLKVTNSSSVSAAAEYQDFGSTWVGDWDDQDSAGIVRIETATYESGEQTSLKVTTTADCSIASPMVVPLNGRFTKLSTAGEDTLTINLAVINSVTLTNANCYLRAQNPDGTTKNLWNLADTRNADILAVGTTLSAGTGDWENNGVALTGYNEYSISITITGGGDSYPLLDLVVMEPSLAGTLYVSRVIEVS